jgi:iron complex outermembrane receptor protein
MMTCALGALGLTAGVSHAATAAAATTASADTSDATNVTELVVIAEKREQSLQKVPVAVSVFTGAQRDTIGISSVQDVTNFAPGFEYNPGNVHAYIRGVGRQSINLTDDSRVTAYEDGFFVYSPYNLDLSSLFLAQEQIERGPQNVGGRNAAAGSIDMISVRPTDHPYAEVRANIANFGTYNIEGAVSGQVAPGLDVRIAGYYHNQDQGYYKNLVNGLSEGNEIHEWYIQPQLDWKPNDKTELWVRAFAANWNNRGDAGARNGFANGSWDETNLTDGNSYAGGGLFVNPNFGYTGPGGNPAAAAALAQARLSAAAGGIGDKDPVPTSVSFAVPGILNNPSATNPNNFAAILPRTNKLNNFNDFNATFTYDVTPDIQFKYIGGYQQYFYTLNYSTPDTDVTSFTLPGSTANAALIGGVNAIAFPGCAAGSALCGGAGSAAQPAVTKLPNPSALVINPTVDLNYIENDQWWSHEISLQSTGDSAFQWTGGLYYYNQHYSNPIQDTDVHQANFTNPVLALPGAVSNAACAPLGGFCGFSAAPLAAANPNDYLFLNTYTMTYVSEAAYGQVSYKFSDQFKITGNLRYTYDHKYGTEAARYVAFSSGVIDGLSPYFGAATPSLDATASLTCASGNNTAGAASCATGALAKGVSSLGVTGADGIIRRGLDDHSSALTGGAGAEWTPNPDTFLYARYGRGYESMSFLAGTVGANPEVSPEYIDAYEIGYKQTFGHTLLIDLAAFYYNYQNLQLPISILNGGVTQTAFFNVPKSVSEGVEFEGYWTPTKDLTITLSYSYDYTAIQTKCSGTITSGVLKPAVGALCLLDSQDPDAVQRRANPFPGQTTAAKDQGINGNPLPDAPRNKVAIDLAYTWHFAPGTLTVSGAYVWRGSQDGTVFNRPYNNAPSWDDFDLRALWRGPNDRYEIIAYVKNIFSSQQYEVGTGGIGLLGNGSSLTNAASGYDYQGIFTIAPPRTYGIEVRYKFF